ncbi:MAG: hypothetical protein AB1742_10210, partial [bacterium]
PIANGGILLRTITSAAEARFYPAVRGVKKDAARGSILRAAQQTVNPISSRYDFRVFLLALGLVGDEFKTARHHLLANLDGDSAFKNGRPRTEQAA